MIRGTTALIAHIGFPTHAFKAPMIYNPYFEHAGIDAVVVPMGCRSEHYPDFLRAVFTLENIRGALITMPHKVSTVALLDEASPTVKIAGACNAVRRGVVATFFPGTPNEFRLMAVHLKSGCPAGPLTAPGRNCELLTRQVAPLEQWIEGEANAGHRFGVLGDFNRRFTIEKGGARDADGHQLNVYAEIDDGEPAASRLTNVTGMNKFKPCTTDSEYKEYIDNILLGRDLAKSIVKKSFVRVVFNDADAKTHWLSDHCPVGIELGLK